MSKLLRSFLLAAVVLTIAVPVALANSTSDVIADLRDGSLDGNYTSSQLREALNSPLLQIYGGDNGVGAVKAELARETQSDNKGTSASSGNLPFTGAEVFTFVGLGAILLVTGIVLRRTNRRGGAS